VGGAPPKGEVNLSPYAGRQFFGQVDIDRATRELTVNLKDLYDVFVFSKTLKPRFGRN
jgi:alkaline phosphatase D